MNSLLAFTPHYFKRYSHITCFLKQPGVSDFPVFTFVLISNHSHDRSFSSDFKEVQSKCKWLHKLLQEILGAKLSEVIEWNT